MIAMPERIWDRWPDEPSMWFERFDKYYRSLGPGRTLTNAYQTHYKDVHGRLPDRPGYIQSWKDNYDEWEWKKRAEAWDTELRRQKLRAEEEAQIDMSQRHIESAQAVQALALEKILEEGFKDASTALRAWRQAVGVEKGARGIPEYIAKVAELDDDELNEQLADALKRAGITGPVGGHDEEAEGITPSETAGSGESGDSDSLSGE